MAQQGQETDPGTDEESRAHWRQVVATMSPMTQEEIDTVAVVLRRIDARRGRWHE